MMTSADTITVGGITYTIQEYISKKEREEVQADIVEDVKERRFYRLPIKERAKQAFTMKGVISTTYQKGGNEMVEKNVKEKILLAVYDLSGTEFSIKDLVNHKDLIQYKPSLANTQLTVAMLYGTLKASKEFDSNIIRRKVGNQHLYLFNNEGLSKADFMEGGEVYKRINEYQKEGRLRKMGAVPRRVQLSSEKKQSKPAEVKVPVEKKEVVRTAIPQDINVTVTVKVEGFVKFLLGFDR